MDGRDTAVELIDNGRLQENLITSAVRACSASCSASSPARCWRSSPGCPRVGEAIVDGPVQIKRAIPTLALIPLLILWFGIGEEMKVITIALGVLVPVYIHTHNGLRSIDGRYVELAETVGAQPGRVRPHRRPARRAARLPARAAVRGHLGAAGPGRGRADQRHERHRPHDRRSPRNYGQTDVIIVGLVVYAALGLVADGSVRLIERRALSWRRTLEG